MQPGMACSLPNAGVFIHIGPSAPVPVPRRAAEALLPARWKHDARHRSRMTGAQRAAKSGVCGIGRKCEGRRGS